MLVQPLVALAQPVAPTHHQLAPPPTAFVFVIAGFALVPFVPTTQALLYSAVAPAQAPTSAFRDH